jgi:hypothetical protein
MIVDTFVPSSHVASFRMFFACRMSFWILRPRGWDCCAMLQE